MRSDLASFDDLPDSALVAVRVVSAVTGEAPSTIWRKAQTEPLLKPIKLGPGATRFRVGPLRTYMSGQGAPGAASHMPMPQPAPPQPQPQPPPPPPPPPPKDGSAPAPKPKKRAPAKTVQRISEAAESKA